MPAKYFLSFHHMKSTILPAIFIFNSVSNASNHIQQSMQDGAWYNSEIISDYLIIFRFYSFQKHGINFVCDILIHNAGYHKLLRFMSQMISFMNLRSEHGL